MSEIDLRHRLFIAAYMARGLSRTGTSVDADLFDEAAARIEQLEAALRSVDDEHGYGLPPETRQMIRAALEERT